MIIDRWQCAAGRAGKSVVRFDVEVETVFVLKSLATGETHERMHGRVETGSERRNKKKMMKALDSDEDEEERDRRRDEQILHRNERREQHVHPLSHSVSHVISSRSCGRPKSGRRRIMSMRAREGTARRAKLAPTGLPERVSRRAAHTHTAPTASSRRRWQSQDFRLRTNSNASRV